MNYTRGRNNFRASVAGHRVVFTLYRYSELPGRYVQYRIKVMPVQVVLLSRKIKGHSVITHGFDLCVGLCFIFKRQNLVHGGFPIKLTPPTLSTSKGFAHRRHRADRGVQWHALPQNHPHPLAVGLCLDLGPW